MRRFVLLVTGLGALTALWALLGPYEHLLRTLLYSCLGVFIARLRVRQVVGAVSLGLVFVLLGIQELTLAEVVITAGVVTIAQFLQQTEAARIPAPVYFHVASTVIGVDLAYRLFHAPWFGPGMQPLALALAAAMLYGWVNTVASIVFGQAQELRLSSVLRECTVRTLPQYIVSAFLASIIHAAGTGGPIYFVLALLPTALLAYSVYIGEQPHSPSDPERSEDLADLQFRALESLALAIEARDLTAPEHLRRLQIYCVELGRDLDLPAADLEGLRVASLLHDVGKLAVPEHILAKGGRLTREEFDAVKIHADVGADIVDRIKFPVPVTEIVRSHHERWNGSGYPKGLKGDQIPLGARILAAVDALDALITEKPYRSALTIDDAVDRLSGEAGISFDPRVVDTLARRYHDLEEMIHEASRMSLGDDLRRLRRAFAPPNTEVPGTTDEKPQFLLRIAQSREEARVLLEMVQDLGKSLQLDESLPALAKRLGVLAPYDSVVIYVLSEGVLAPRYSAGESTAIWMSRQIAVGQGVVGSVVSLGKPVLNGDLAMEFPAAAGIRPVGLAVPLVGANEIVGVLLLTRRAPHQFTSDHLRIALAIHGKLGAALENGISYEQARLSASTDFLTGLPNARSLHQHLESELSRCRRSNSSLTVLVADLDGFKEVNDRFGHLEGNRLLQAVARNLRQSCRDYDYVARLGGDEFVFILPGLAKLDGALKIQQLIRAVAEAGRTVVPESSLGLSIGEARFPENGTTAEELLLEADQQMYKVKTARKLKQRREARSGFAFDREKFPLSVDH
ncbi:MAG: diguanylate cyclase [Bryobacterales bacterium]|nr:diguanylate cyclase [Bryobacterales bacterium]